MDGLDQQVLAAARRWSEAGHRFALVTVALGSRVNNARRKECLSGCGIP